jgi:phosphatidate cytidylyltransferase
LRYSDDDGGGPIDWDPDDDVVQEASGVTITGAHQAVTRPPDHDAPPEASLDDWSFVRGTSPDPELPHWTEAPTGQVPAVLSREEPTSPSDDPWSSLPAPSWRQDETDWTAQEHGFEPAMLGDEGGSAPVHGDEGRRPWEFDRDEDPPTTSVPAVSSVEGPTEPGMTTAARTTRVRPRTRRVPSDGPLTGRAARPSGSRDMTTAIVTGFVLLLVVVVGFDVSTVLAAIICAVAVTLGAGEAYSAMRLAGHRPASALGLVAALSLMVASYNKGIAALPLVAALCFFFTFLWYMAGVERADVIDGVATTLLVFIWVGTLGAFAGLLLAPSSFPRHDGVHFLLGAIFVTVAYDVGALVSGKLLGRHAMAPTISPNKTWEGAIGGGVFAIIVGACVSAMSPWTMSAALTLGLCAAVLAPLGDLCESMFKRSLGLKDMGRTLPGHGGLLDRLDGLLFVLPATYYVVLSFHLH